jgi:hypothetical protein
MGSSRVFDGNSWVVGVEFSFLDHFLHAWHVPIGDWNGEFTDNFPCCEEVDA